jgi:4'-phosphopantetheinyl transferase
MKMLSLAPTFLLKPGEVHAWLFDLDDLGNDFSGYGLILSEEETLRSERYHFEKDRQRFIARRSLLRQLLGRYCGIAPREIVYETNQFGKLSLSSKPICFNLSARQNKIAFAFNLQNEIGVDIEKATPLPGLLRIAETRFSSVEKGRLAMLAAEKQLDSFYHIWTQKEAFVKAHGEGLSLPLNDFSVEVDPDVLGEILMIQGGTERSNTWKMYTLITEPGWSLAVCVQAQSEQDIHLYMPTKADFMSLMGDL